MKHRPFGSGTSEGHDAPDAFGAVVARSGDALFRAIFDAAGAGILVFDGLGCVLNANRALEELLGYKRDELAQRIASELAPSGAPSDLADALHALLAGDDVRATVEAQLERRDGGVVWANVELSRLARGDGGEVLAIAHDITERKRLEIELRHQAFHDALTGLANRVLFRERIEHALLNVARGGQVALLLVDLDEFKTVNDSMGQQTGDELLRRIGDRLRQSTRAHDTIARLGGDEFGVLLEGFTSELDLNAIVARVFDATKSPIEIGGRTLSLSACLGLAHARVGESADELLRNADVAMHRAKEEGAGRTSVFEPSMHVEIIERLALEEDLREAVERGAFHLTYQPLVELESWKLLGLEALLRWNHSRRGSVSPAAFIPAAERTGLIVPLGRWILGEACRQLAAWRSAHPNVPLPGISVNVSGRQLEDDSFVGDVARTLAEHGVSATSLTLEITESSILSRTSEMLERLLALKALGVRLAIDDFGTGYSSLSYLQRFPFDVLKVDKAFVDGVANGGSDAQLTRAIIALAKALRLRTVAEGIERPEQWAELRALGCQVGQGYLFSRPLSPDAVEALLAEMERDDEMSTTLRIAR